MESLWQALVEFGSIATPQSWGFMALCSACVSMMWYFNSAGHHLRMNAGIVRKTEEKRILELTQQAIAEGFELKYQKGELSTPDKEAMYGLVFKHIPKMKELKPDSKDVASTVSSLIGVGAKIRTKWPFRSKADEARADLALLVNSVNKPKGVK